MQHLKQTQLLRRNYILLLILTGFISLSLLWLWHWVTNPVPVTAIAGIRYVAPDGDNAFDCDTPANRCRAIQRAVDVALPGDEIRIAQGTYTETTTMGSVEQVIYISKTLTLRGGFTTTNPQDTLWLLAYPITQSTIIDAQGQGRGVYITGDITVTLEGLQISNGDATTLGGAPANEDCGGGTYITAANVTISDTYLTQNTGEDLGGGLCALSATLQLENSTIMSNTADWGGALSLWDSQVNFEHNQIVDNAWQGIDVNSSVVNLTGNTINNNQDGGIYALQSQLMLINNTLNYHTATGVYLEECTATFDGNTLMYNNYDSGVQAHYSTLTLTHNTIMSNTGDEGGGVLCIYSHALLEHNTIAYNKGRNGGGVLGASSSITMSHNTIRANSADDFGGGVHILETESMAYLAHNRIARNISGLEGGGIHIIGVDRAVLSHNTILDNHAPFGGGLILHAGQLTFVSNNVISNTSEYNGGGLSLGGVDGIDDVLENNVFMYNRAILGGGIELYKTTATLSNTIITTNYATYGGGLAVIREAPRLINTILANNIATDGSAMYIEETDLQMAHTTIADNIGKSGILISNSLRFAAPSHLILTNTILSGPSVGISIIGGNTVTVDSILWHNIPVTISASPTATIHVQHAYTGDPAFVDAANADYHLGPNSAAIDKGIDAGISTDLDGTLRPQGSAPDLGAYEFIANTEQVYLPLIIRKSN